MLEAQHLSAGDARVVPWKNGRGVTRELALWPADARFERLEFDWRISSAPVDEPGPFSVFPGVERILVVTEGAGLVLTHGGDASGRAAHGSAAHGTGVPRARLRRLEPYRFAGDWQTTAELPHGPITDFNVMLRRGRANASVQALKLGARRAREALAAGHCFVHVLGAAASVRVTGEEEPYELDAGDSLWLRGLGGGEELDLLGHSRETELLLVGLLGGLAEPGLP